MKFADKLGVKYTLVLGENEINAGKAKLRIMNGGEEKEISLVKLLDEIKG